MAACPLPGKDPWTSILKDDRMAEPYSSPSEGAKRGGQMEGHSRFKFSVILSDDAEWCSIQPSWRVGQADRIPEIEVKNIFVSY